MVARNIRHDLGELVLTVVAKRLYENPPGVFALGFVDNRDRKRADQLTEAGRTFVQEAQSALLHADRSIHLARAAHHGYENVLLVGHEPHADQTWVSTLLTIGLPLFPKLKVRLTTHFTMELVRSVLANELHVALVTVPPVDGKLTAVPFGQTQQAYKRPRPTRPRLVIYYHGS